MVQILLAAYQSELHLREQLDSVFAQTESGFELLVHDGGSTDATAEIIREYQLRYPGKIRDLGSSRASALENFALLLAAADGEYFMYCDHDDVWLPDKIRLSLEAFKRAEAEYGSTTPLLLFTDSEVVDHEMNRIAPSLMRYQKLQYSDFSPSRLIVQNAASGHTMLFNRALKELLLPIPAGALYHDHWTALAASFFGKIIYVDTPTVRYRQHGSNVLGAFRYGLGSFCRKLSAGRAEIRERFARNMDQAAALLELHGEKLSANDRRLLDDLRRYRRMGWLERRRFLCKYRLKKNGMLRNIGMFLFT